VLAAEWGTGQVFWSLLWFFLLFIEIWLLVIVLSDVFRSPDLSGWGKALWTVFALFLPFIGIFVYLVARGDKMQAHTIRASQLHETAFRTYAQGYSGANVGQAADELSRLADLRDQGMISDGDLRRAKSKVLG
jgi:Phospholipase_D-nuclease N-terminal